MAELETLLAELYELAQQDKEFIEPENSINTIAANTIKQLIAERDAATKDSARYNWLISQEAWEPQRDTLPKWYGGKIKWLGGTYSLNEINEIIDEAMK